jgi:hypothetical protein
MPKIHILKMKQLSQLIAALALCGLSQAADWPQWGGTPGRNMYSPAKGLPGEFGEFNLKAGTEEIELKGTKNVKWIAKLGSQSYGNVTVAGGRVFVGATRSIRATAAS